MSRFTTDGNASVLEHMPMELLHALFDRSGGTFIETVHLIYQVKAIYCFLSYHIYAHHTKSSDVMKMTNKFDLQDQRQRK